MFLPVNIDPVLVPDPYSSVTSVAAIITAVRPPTIVFPRFTVSSLLSVAFICDLGIDCYY